MICKIRYTPEAQRDMDAVWDGVLEASGDYDTADRYVEEFADEIAKKKEYPHSGIPLEYNGLFTGYYSVIYKAYRAFYRVRNEYIEVLRQEPTQQNKHSAAAGNGRQREKERKET